MTRKKKWWKPTGCAGCFLLILAPPGLLILISIYLDFASEPPKSFAPEPPQSIPIVKYNVSEYRGVFTNYNGDLLLLDHERRLIGVINPDRSVKYPDEEKIVGQVRSDGNGGWFMIWADEAKPVLAIDGQPD